MRTNPTSIDTSGTAGDYELRTPTTDRACTAVPTIVADNYNSKDVGYVFFTVTAGHTANADAGFLRAATSSTDAFIGFSASAISDTCSNSIRVLKTYRQTNIQRRRYCRLQLFRRNYTFDFQYSFNYPISDGLNINYSAANNNIVRNYFVDDIINGSQDPSLDVWNRFFDIGDPNRQNQQLADKLQKIDLTAAAIANAEGIERAVNRGTVNAGRCFELLSGAELNEKERTAENGISFNREYPWLYDDYKSRGLLTTTQTD